MLSTKWHIWYIGIFKGISYWAAYIVDRVTRNENNRVYIVKFGSISSKLKTSIRSVKKVCMLLLMIRCFQSFLNIVLQKQTMCEFSMIVINCSGHLECKTFLKYHSRYITRTTFYRKITEIDLKGIFIKASHAIVQYKWNILYWPTNFGDDSLFFIWNHRWEYPFHN